MWCLALCPFSASGRPSGKSTLLGEIISVFSPERNFFSTDGRMDPAGLEPASATLTRHRKTASRGHIVTARTRQSRTAP